MYNEANKMNCDHLKLVTYEELRELFPKMGDRIAIRTKIDNWRLQLVSSYIT